MSQIYVEQIRQHSAAGSFGGTVSGATNATPIVITTSAAHGLIDGDQVQVTGVGGNTAANTTGYAKVTGYSGTTFALYQDAGLSTAVAGNGAYTSGGAVSKVQDISGLSGDFTLRLNINGLTAGKNAVVCVQDSADGFVSDIKTLWTENVAGGQGSAFYVPVNSFSVRAYQLPSLRIGVANARLRLFVQELDGGATVTTTLVIEQ